MHLMKRTIGTRTFLIPVFTSSVYTVHVFGFPCIYICVFVNSQ